MENTLSTIYVVELWFENHGEWRGIGAAFWTISEAAKCAAEIQHDGKPARVGEFTRK